MNAHSLSTTFRRRNLAALFLVLLTSIIVFFGFAPGAARSPQDGPGTSEVMERRFENTIPEHVPIKVKLKSEKSFKDLKNKNWARELEIEVRNTGSKPIYYLYVVIAMPDLLVGGHRLTMRASYGRAELGLPQTPVEPEDVPVLLPGQSLVVKLPEKQVRAYEAAREEQGRPDPKIVEFEMQAVKFGDGTSFRGRAGGRWREATKEQVPKQRSQLKSGGCKSSETQTPSDSVRSFQAYTSESPQTSCGLIYCHRTTIWCRLQSLRRIYAVARVLMAVCGESSAGQTALATSSCLPLFLRAAVVIAGNV